MTHPHDRHRIELLRQRVVAVWAIHPPDSDDRWFEDGRCTSDDRDRVLYPDGRHRSSPDGRRLCEPCPVRDRCLLRGMWYDEQDGIWGGATVSERSAVRRVLQLGGLRMGARHQSGTEVLGWSRRAPKTAPPPDAGF